MKTDIFDIAIIGAGVTGCAVARALSAYDRRVVLIDAAQDVGMGASRANSAIVHAGYDCVPGTDMARLNVLGNRMYDAWCEELDVPLKRIGSLVVAITPEDERVINDLYARGRQNGVPGMRVITGDEARAIEPKLSSDITLALWAPTAAITCPYEMTIACAENARDNGVSWHLGSPVTAIERVNDALMLTFADQTQLSARRVVNAAGVFADEIARMAGDSSIEIFPRRGEYILLDRGAFPLNTVLFQTPSKLGKGVLVSPTVDGNTFAGPTAIDMEDKTDTSVAQTSIDELTALARKTAPGFNTRQVITNFAGIRAQTREHDFLLRVSDAEPRMIHAAGICSPGLSAAPAIALTIVRLIEESGMSLSKKADYNPRRRRIPLFRHMTDEEKRAAIAENPLYAHVVCRCETVTEAEIVEAIHRGARDLDGVKRRTRAGMGRCQGGFCSPRVMRILSRELNVPMESLTKFGGQSNLLVRKTREDVAHE